MTTPDEMDDFDRLHDLVAEMEDIKSLLDGMTGLAAISLTRVAGANIECAVTLHRKKRPATIAGSSDQAVLLDGIEQRLGDGPCLQALRTGEPVLLGDPPIPGGPSSGANWRTKGSAVSSGCRCIWEKRLQRH